MVLVWPWTAAAGAAGKAEAARHFGFDPWALAARVWAFLAGSADNGCSLDPSGGCAGKTPVIDSVDEGCSVDPDGRCAGRAAAELVDNGCSVDPDGRCAGSSAGNELVDEGCSVDPSGGCRQ